MCCNILTVFMSYGVCSETSVCRQWGFHVSGGLERKGHGHWHGMGCMWTSDSDKRWEHWRGRPWLPYYRLPLRPVTRLSLKLPLRPLILKRVTHSDFFFQHNFMESNLSFLPFFSPSICFLVVIKSDHN